MRISGIGDFVSSVGMAGRCLCIAVPCGTAGTENGLHDFSGFCHNLSHKGAEYDLGRRYYQKRRHDALCDVDRYDRYLGVWRAAWLFGGVCLGTADSAGVFHPLPGGGREIFDLRGCFSKNELDAAAVGREGTGAASVRTNS